MRGLEPAQHALLREVGEHHVDGLDGKIGQLLRACNNGFGRGMRVLFEGVEHGKAAAGYPAARGRRIVVPNGPCDPFHTTYFE